MSTHEMLSNFTNKEIADLHLQHRTLKELSDSELLKLAQMRLERFQPQTPKQSEIKGTLSNVLCGIAASLACDGLKLVWTTTLTQINQLITELLAK